MRWRGASRRSARPGRGLCSKTKVAIVGYAYASAHHERAAYRWSVSTAIYVSRDHHRRGAGRALYTTLFALLRALGYRQATAGITLPNPASVGLHEAFGFAPVGVYRQIGYKMGEWHDVGWYQAEIQPAAVRARRSRSRCANLPALPRGMRQCSGGWTSVLRDRVNERSEKRITNRGMMSRPKSSPRIFVLRSSFFVTARSAFRSGASDAGAAASRSP